MKKLQREGCTCDKQQARESIIIPGTVICDNCMEVISYNGNVIASPDNKKDKKASSQNIKIVRTDFSGVGIEVNKIYNEDCIETIRKIKDGQLDYVFTSPPYNVGKGSFAKYEGGEQFGDEKSQQAYFDWCVSIIDGLLRATKNHIFWNVQQLTDNRIAIMSLIEHYRYKLKEQFIWVKRSVAPASTAGVTNSKWEHILCFSNQEPLLRRFKDGNFHGNFSNVIDVSREINEYAEVHKATFPITLPVTFMDMFGVKGDLWYDPFMGTGTTARAAISRKRNFLGSEMSKKYWKLANTETIKFADSQQGIIDFVEEKKTDKEVEQLRLDM